MGDKQVDDGTPGSGQVHVVTPPPASTAPYFAERQAGYEQAGDPTHRPPPDGPPPPYMYAAGSQVPTQPAGQTGLHAQSPYFAERQAGYDQSSRATSGMYYPQEPARPGTTVVVSVGDTCPSCRTGTIQEAMEPCAVGGAVLLGILLFPIGVLCCICVMMAATEHKCDHCGRIY